MFRCTAAVVVLALLSACGTDQAPDTAGDTMPGAAASGIAADLNTADTPNGVEVYRNTCSACHDEGANGAPRIGHPEDWSGRSPLWEAVLFEHAKTGFLDMPAKGGNEALDDADVGKAAEYMLRSTFPEIPPD